MMNVVLIGYKLGINGNNIGKKESKWDMAKKRMTITR